MSDAPKQPASFSFEDINEFVHSDVSFEELQSALLGAACHIEKLLRGEFVCAKCGIRKDSDATIEGREKPEF